MRRTALLLLLVITALLFDPLVIPERMLCQVPSSWREVMEDGATTGLFFDIYSMCVSSTSANASVALEVLSLHLVVHLILHLILLHI